MSIAAVVLAAGASRRLGRPKQQVVIAGETLLARTVRTASEAGLSPVIVVTRDSEQTRDGSLNGACFVTNNTADEGIASSIRYGIAAAEQQRVTGAVILTCDQPALTSKHLRAIVCEPGRLTASEYGGTVGVPAYFPAEFFSSLLQLRGDTGARSMLKTAYCIRAEECGLDIDTEDDVIAARAILERRSGD